jgi:hypothetical protein
MMFARCSGILADSRQEINFPWFHMIKGANTFLGGCLPFDGKLTGTAK